eukprot:scaffold579088_cov47-Prasinocladus_malaysianus.AAC.1
MIERKWSVERQGEVTNLKKRKADGMKQSGAGVAKLKANANMEQSKYSELKGSTIRIHKPGHDGEKRIQSGRIDTAGRKDCSETAI